MYLKGEQFEQALRMAEVAVTRSKDNPKYRVCLVEALRRSGNGKRAEDEMRAVMALAPKDPAVAAQAARLGMR
jgi:Flp pilus assembly protein TadD